MNSIKIYFGADSDFDKAIQEVEDYNTISDLFNHINKQEIQLTGPGLDNEPDRFEINNLIIRTDDYGGIKEWALLAFSNNVLKHSKIKINNMWMNNPPDKIYQDIMKAYSKEIISEFKTKYKKITLKILKKISDKYSSAIIGQDAVIKKILSSLYLVRNRKRKKPVAILFLGKSGVGKTETAKFINSFFKGQMMRVQFSMQQTGDAYKYIFGAEHGENCLARELIRRESNIVLLDEFDKVHPSFYNAFYQMFDEGTFVDSNYTVKVKKCVIICTTNYSSEEEAEKELGTPIFSRFSKVIKFNPISKENKIKIAEKCYAKIFKSLDDKDQKLIESNTILEKYIGFLNKGYYDNMRMLNNDIEDAINYEILRVRKIL